MSTSIAICHGLDFLPPDQTTASPTMSSPSPRPSLLTIRTMKSSEILLHCWPLSSLRIHSSSNSRTSAKPHRPLTVLLQKRKHHPHSHNRRHIQVQIAQMCPFKLSS